MAKSDAIALLSAQGFGLDPDGAAKALLALMDDNDGDGLAALAAARPGAAKLDAAQRASVWKSLHHDVRNSNRSTAVKAIAACGISILPDEADSADLHRVLESVFEYANADAMGELAAIGLRAPASQLKNCVGLLGLMKPKDLANVVPQLSRLGISLANHSDVLTSFANDIETTRLLLSAGARPSAPFRRGDMRVYDAVAEDRTEPKAARVLLARLLEEPLDAEVIAQIARLGGEVPDASAWKPGDPMNAESLSRALWMLSETKWPDGTTLRSVDADRINAVSDFRPRRLTMWNAASEGWRVEAPYDHLPLWSWGESREQERVALEVGAHSGPTVHVLDHVTNNLEAHGPPQAKFLSTFLAGLVRQG